MALISVLLGSYCRATNPSRASPGTIYSFWDSPFALCYLPRSRDNQGLQVIYPFRDNPTFWSFFYALSTYTVYFRRNSTLLLNQCWWGKALSTFPFAWFHITCSHASNSHFHIIGISTRIPVTSYSNTDILYPNIMWQKCYIQISIRIWPSVIQYIFEYINFGLVFL
jgi:hypothetical protein